MPLKEDLLRPDLFTPRNLPSLTLKDWDYLIRLGRKAEMLGRIHALLVLPLRGKLSGRDGDRA